MNERDAHGWTVAHAGRSQGRTVQHGVEGVKFREILRHGPVRRLSFTPVQHLGSFWEEQR